MIRLFKRLIGCPSPVDTARRRMIERIRKAEDELIRLCRDVPDGVDDIREWNGYVNDKRMELRWLKDALKSIERGGSAS